MGGVVRGSSGDSGPMTGMGSGFEPQADSCGFPKLTGLQLALPVHWEIANGISLDPLCLEVIFIAFIII